MRNFVCGVQNAVSANRLFFHFCDCPLKNKMEITVYITRFKKKKNYSGIKHNTDWH